MVTSKAIYEYTNRLDTVIARPNQKFSKVTIALNEVQPYITTIVALMTRGGGLCLIGLCGQDGGTKPNIVRYLLNSGDYSSYFYYHDINNQNKIELYWTGSAYSTRDSIAILTNKKFAKIENTSYVNTLPSGVVSL